MDRKDVLKFYSIQEAYADLVEEEKGQEVVVASIGEESFEIVDVFSRVDRKISLAERVVLASASLLEFSNPCQHAPYPEGRSCDFPSSGEHRPASEVNPFEFLLGEEGGSVGTGEGEIAGVAEAEAVPSGAVGTAGYWKEKYPSLSDKQVDYLEHSYFSSHKGEKREKFIKTVEKTQAVMEGLPAEQRADYFPDGKPIPGTAEWRDAHGISESAFLDRPYHRFEKGQAFEDLPPEVRAMYEGNGATMDGAKRQLLKIMAQDGGIIMERHPVPGTPFSKEPIPPQVRPDQAIINDRRDLKRRETGVAYAEKAQKEAAEFTVENGGAIEKQKSRVENAKSNIEKAQTATRESYMEDAVTVEAQTKEAYLAIKGKVKTGEATVEERDEARIAHTKADAALKRVTADANRKFGASGERTEEYRAVATENAKKELKWAESKLERYNEDPALAVINEQESATKRLAKARDQLDKVPAKYLFPPVPEDLKGLVKAGKALSSSARVEVHGKENIRRLLETKGRVYIAMEGNLKSDSVLSAIEREGDPDAAVISVPSVTLWRHNEMKAVAEQYLKGREVILIPDADGETNVNVRNEARALQALMQNSGVTDVKIAAPPMDRSPILTPGGKQRTDHGVALEDVHPKEFTLPSGAGEKAKGADDWLATNSGLGGTLGGMDVQRRVTPKIVTLDELSSADQSAFLSGKYKGDAVVVGADTINAKAREHARAAMVGLHTLLGERGSGVVNVTRLGSTMGKFYDNGDQAGSSLGVLEKEGLIKTEYLYDPDEFAAGRRVMHPSMTVGRIKELVKAGVIQPPDYDSETGAPQDIGETGEGRLVEQGKYQSPIITITEKGGAGKTRDLPRAPLDKIGRQVSSPEGAAYYGVPIGTTITPEILSRAALKARK